MKAQYLPYGDMGETTFRVLHAVRSADDPMTPANIADNLGIERNTAKVLLWRLYKRGLLAKVHRGQYIDTPNELGHTTLD